MKNIFTLWAALLLALVPIAAFAACSGQFSITYPTGSTSTTKQGAADVTGTYCPNAIGSTQVVIVLPPLARLLQPAPWGTTCPFAVYSLTNTVACNDAKHKTIALTLTPDPARPAILVRSAWAA